jgi:hypothetical protein
MSEYRIKSIDTIEQFYELSEYWNDLLVLSRSNTICLTFEWIYTWAECFLATDRKLFVLAIYEKERLIGIAPWCIHEIAGPLQPFRQIEFLGTPEMGSDYLDVIIKKGKEKVITQCIYEYVFGQAAQCWETVLLQDIPSDSLFLNYFLENLREDGKYVLIREGPLCPTVELPNSWQDYLKDLSSNRREQFRRHHRLLKRRGEVKYEKIIQGKDDRWNMDRFISLYENWWGKEQDKNFYTHLRQFAARCASQFWLQMDFLSVNGTDVAALFHSRYNGNLSMHLMAVDKEFRKKISVGNILVGLCLQEAISDGIKLYDFLKGTEDYKFHWANHSRRTLEVNLYQRNMKAFGKLSFTMLKDLARIYLR